MAELPLRLLVAVVFATGAAPADAAPLSVDEVAPGVFVHRGIHEDFNQANLGGIANLAFVVGDEAVAVIDTGGSLEQGHLLRAAIAQHTDLPVAFVINTHAHPDHVLGNAAFMEAEPVFVGHANLPRALAERGPHYLKRLGELMGEALDGSALIPPGLLVEDRLSLDLGGRTLELRAWATAHSDCDLTVLDPTSATLFAGDLVFMQRIPVIDGRLLGWLEVMDELAELPARRVVPGHGAASAPWPEALDEQRAYLRGLRDRLRDAIDGGIPLSRAVDAVPMTGAWALAKENHPRNVMAGYTELEWE